MGSSKMASYSARKLLLLRRVSTLRGAVPSASFRGPSLCPPSEFPESSSAHLFLRALCSASSFASRRFCSRTSHLDEELQGPGAIDYCSLLLEDEFHKLADSTIHDLLENLEEYGDSIQTDGFDIDYGNGVLTLKLGDLGTYVLNKQAPNRQIWLSSPVSGPARFDWDPNAQAWIYRRNKGNLLRILESELERLCGEPVNLA